MTKMRRSSRDVFRDLGFTRQQAANLRIRSELMSELSDFVDREGLTQSAAARVFGVSQPRISDLVRGKIDLFTIDALVEMLAKAGRQVRVKVARAAGSGRPQRRQPFR